MNARKTGARRWAMWFTGAILLLFAAMLLGGCRERKGFFRHEPNLRMARHGGHERVVLVEHERPRGRMTARRREYDRGSDRRHREEARHDRKERTDDRRTDRRGDDRPRSRRR